MTSALDENKQTFFWRQEKKLKKNIATVARALPTPISPKDTKCIENYAMPSYQMLSFRLKPSHQFLFMDFDWFGTLFVISETTVLSTAQKRTISLHS